MEISDLLKNTELFNRNIAVCHSSRCDGATEIIPNSVDEVWKLLKLYAPASHQHLNNAYLIIYHRPTMEDFGYIDLVNLKEKIRNKNLNKITND